MVVILTDGSDKLEEISNFLSTHGLEFRIVPIKEFKEGLKGNVEFVIYDTYNFTYKDVENIKITKEFNIPVLLITAYPEQWAIETISKLWRYDFIKDYLVKPVDIKKLAAYFPTCKTGGDAETIRI
ncbi:MAG: hypothetical protein HZC45_00550 [Deltaproteobacteria bacterium]|nr:hypothetical protein [Deltaproteobacteria bacterium]